MRQRWRSTSSAALVLLSLSCSGLPFVCVDAIEWVCSVDCENEGFCGDSDSAEAKNHLLPRPCAGPGELRRHAGCDWNVCADVCSDLDTNSSSTTTVEVNGKKYDCFSSEKRSYKTKIEASEASISFGCGLEGRPHAGSWLVAPECYHPEVGSVPDWDTTSHVRDADFCYGISANCTNKIEYENVTDTGYYLCLSSKQDSNLTLKAAADFCNLNKTLIQRITSVRQALHATDLRVELLSHELSELKGSISKKETIHNVHVLNNTIWSRILALENATTVGYESSEAKTRIYRVYILAWLTIGLFSIVSLGLSTYAVFETKKFMKRYSRFQIQ